MPKPRQKPIPGKTGQPITPPVFTKTPLNPRLLAATRWRRSKRYGWDSR